MFRVGGKVFRRSHLLSDAVIANDDPSMTRTKKVFAAVDDLCREFDLSRPIWLDSNIAEFKRHSKTRFYQDNFIDTIDFDFLEIHVIEEDA